MRALPPIADIGTQSGDVRFVAGSLQNRRVDLSIRIVRVHQNHNRRAGRNQLLYHFQAFCSEQGSVSPKSGDVPAGLIEAADKAELHWIATACEHDGYRRRRRKAEILRQWQLNRTVGARCRRRVQRCVVIAIAEKESGGGLAAQEWRREHIGRSDKPEGEVCVDVGIDADVDLGIESSDRDIAGHGGIAARRNGICRI